MVSSKKYKNTTPQSICICSELKEQILCLELKAPIASSHPMGFHQAHSGFHSEWMAQAASWKSLSCEFSSFSTLRTMLFQEARTLGFDLEKILIRKYIQEQVSLSQIRSLINLYIEEYPGIGCLQKDIQEVLLHYLINCFLFIS